MNVFRVPIDVYLERSDTYGTTKRTTRDLEHTVLSREPLLLLLYPEMRRSVSNTIPIQIIIIILTNTSYKM